MRIGARKSLRMGLVPAACEEGKAWAFRLQKGGSWSSRWRQQQASKTQCRYVFPWRGLNHHGHAPSGRRRVDGQMEQGAPEGAEGKYC